MAVPVQNCTEKVFCVIELPANDLIFNKRTPGVNNTLLDDHDYRYEDFTRHVFTNISTYNVYGIYPNNIMFPVRFKRELSEYAGRKAIDDALGISNVDRGIYIVDTYSMYNTPNTNFKEVFNYFLKTNNLEISDLEKEKIIKSLIYCKDKHSYRLSFRLVSYISEVELNEFSYIYSSGSGLCLS